MTKEDMLQLWGAEHWDNQTYGVYFVGNYNGHHLNLNFTGYSEQDILDLSNDDMNSLFVNLAKLDSLAHDVIQNAESDEDTSALALSDITFDKSGCYHYFALGYDIGESPAGELYIMVKFDKNFKPETELVYETY